MNRKITPQVISVEQPWWFNDAPRYEYIEYCRDNENWADRKTPQCRLLELAGVEEKTTVSVKVIQGWFQEYDLPDYDNIELPTEEDLVADRHTHFTLPEIVVLARVRDWPMPKTIQAMRRKAKAENWTEKARYREDPTDG